MKDTQIFHHLHVGFFPRDRFLCQFRSQCSNFFALLLSPCWPITFFKAWGLYLSTQSNDSSDWPAAFWGLAVLWELKEDWLLVVAGEVCDWLSDFGVVGVEGVYLKLDILSALGVDWNEQNMYIHLCPAWNKYVLHAPDRENTQKPWISLV